MGVPKFRNSFVTLLIGALMLVACGSDDADEPTDTAAEAEGTEDSETGAGEGAGTEESEPAADLRPLRVLSAGVGIMYMFPTIAESQGYFAEEGLEVEQIEGAAGGSDAAAAITGGSVELVQTGLDHVLAANEQGLALRAIAPAAEEFILSMAVASEVVEELDVAEDASVEQKMQALADHGGIKVGISSFGSSTDAFMTHLCDVAGISCENDIELVALGAVGDVTAALEQRQINAMVRSHPDVDQAMARADAELYLSSPRGDVPTLKGYLYLVMVSNDEVIADFEPELQAYLRAIGKAMKFVQAYPDEASAIVKDYAAPDLDQAVWDSAWETNLSALPEDPIIEPDGVQVTYEDRVAREGGELGIEPEDVWQSDLAEAAWADIEDWEPEAP